MKKIKIKNIVNTDIIGYEHSESRGMIVQLSEHGKKYRAIEFSENDDFNSFWDEVNFKSVKSVCKDMRKSFISYYLKFYKFNSYKELLKWISKGV